MKKLTYSFNGSYIGEMAARQGNGGGDHCPVGKHLRGRIPAWHHHGVTARDAIVLGPLQSNGVPHKVEEGVLQIVLLYRVLPPYKLGQVIYLYAKLYQGSLPSFLFFDI